MTTWIVHFRKATHRRGFTTVCGTFLGNWNEHRVTDDLSKVTCRNCARKSVGEDQIAINKIVDLIRSHGLSQDQVLEAYNRAVIEEVTDA